MRPFITETSFVKAWRSGVFPLPSRNPAVAAGTASLDTLVPVADWERGYTSPREMPQNLSSRRTASAKISV